MLELKKRAAGVSSGDSLNTIPKHREKKLEQVALPENIFDDNPS